MEAFHREVAGLLGREPVSLPIASAEAREGTTRDLSHHLNRLGLPRAVAVARRAISKQAGRGAPGSLAFFVGWLAQEPTAPAAPKRATGDLGVERDEWWRRVTPERRAEFCAARIQLDPGLWS